MKRYKFRLGICIASVVCAFLWVAFERLFFPDLSAENGFLICLGFAFISWITTSPIFFQKYVKEATPESLGAIRIVVCLIQLIMTLWLEDLPSTALLPAELRSPMGVMQYFYNIPGFESFARNQTSLQMFEWLTALLLVFGIIGWRTRIVLPLGALCYLILGGIPRQYTWFYHTGLIPVYLMAILSFTPCADGLSVDRLWKVYRGQTVPAADQPLPIYGWSRYACWVVVALSYVQAGFSKIYKSGLFWWDPENMKAIIFSSTLDPVQTNWEVALKLVHAPDILFALLGIAGMYGEIAYGLVLFSAIARKILPIFMASVHIGILFLQDILFLDLIILQLIFYDFTQARKTIKKWVASRVKPIQILYNRASPSDRTAVRCIQEFDLFERIEAIDLCQLNLPEYNKNHNLNLTSDELETKIYLIKQGQTYRGFEGFRSAALVLPAFWILLPFLFLPGLSSIGKSIYQKITHNSFKNPPTATSSKLNQLSTQSPNLIAPFRKSSQNIYLPLLVAALTVSMVFIWAKHREFYPITSLQMFSGYNNTGFVGYTKLVAHYESGETTRIFPDTIIHPPMNTRYRLTMKGCLGDKPKSIDLCDKLLHNLGDVHNQKVDPGEKISKLEVQLWLWNYRSNPSDLNYGELQDSHSYQILKKDS
ncbi:MAG: DCC1-like thiol-disulfide oxidoreductase family protein [Cyanobacteriota bacterium]|nr:DCC1-like thiol-disulfide oxidoreductase family protein [Cyanobacteriota bacterium]